MLADLWITLFEEEIQQMGERYYPKKARPLSEAERQQLYPLEDRGCPDVKSVSAGAGAEQNHSEAC